jgi:hypothetical protein
MSKFPAWNKIGTRPMRYYPSEYSATKMSRAMGRVHSKPFRPVLALEADAWLLQDPEGDLWDIMGRLPSEVTREVLEFGVV